MASLDSTQRLVQSVVQRRGLRQFVKFCIVGASSTAISGGIYTWLIYGVHLDRIVDGWLAGAPQMRQIAGELRLYVQLAALIAFLFAVTNGFIWNSKWTFRQRDAALRRVQYLKFVMVNVVGLVLNQIIVFIVTGALTAGRPQHEKGLAPLIAFAVATGIVVFWNFLANKYWTFRS